VASDGIGAIQPSVLELGRASAPDGSVDTLSVTVEAATTVDLKAPTVTIDGATLVDIKSAAKIEIDSAVVEAGAGPTFDSLALYTQLKAEFDAHIHPDPVSGVSGPPTVPLSALVSSVHLMGS
jgi:hypothetical protein